MKRALLIGINYTSIPDITLSGCIDDIVNMQGVLIDAYDYQSSNIILLRDDIDDPTRQPTLANITAQLKQLASQSSASDEIWVHYSGHGSQLQKINDPNKDDVDSILVPLDYHSAGFIHEDDLLAIIQTIKCRGIFLFDCCHSGSICELPWSILYKSPSTYSTIKNNNIQVKNPNIFVFSGCKDNQTCADTYSDVLAESVGVFTSAFIECLRNSRHNTSLLLLYRDICMSLSSSGYTQTPVLSLSAVPSTFVLTRAPPVLPTIPTTKATIKKQMGSIIYG